MRFVIVACDTGTAMLPRAPLADPSRRTLGRDCARRGRTAQRPPHSHRRLSPGPYRATGAPLRRRVLDRRPTLSCRRHRPSRTRRAPPSAPRRGGTRAGLARVGAVGRRPPPVGIRQLGLDPGHHARPATLRGRCTLASLDAIVCVGSQRSFTASDARRMHDLLVDRGQRHATCVALLARGIPSIGRVWGGSESRLPADDRPPVVVIVESSDGTRSTSVTAGLQVDGVPE